MPKHFRIVIGSASFLAIGAPLLVQPASATTTEPVTEAVDGPVTPAERGEIVVTAQRRSENIQDVGMSLTALDDTKIARMVVANATDLTAQIPNLRFTSLGTSSVVVYNIRGVSQNDFLDHLEPPIAVYQDDAYLSTVTQAGVPVFDVQRAEVLRGPQGTLFGRNATGGLIHFISNQPTDTPDGYVDLTFADDLWGKVEGAVGGPLGPTLSARVAATISSREGYGENASGGRKLGADHYVAGRMILAFRPVEDIQADLTLRYIKNFDGTGSPFHFSPTIPDADGLGRFVRPTENPYNTCNGCGPAFYEGYLQKKPYKGSYSTAGHYEREVFGATIKLSKDFGALQLESITDYQHLTKDTYEDSDATPLPIATNAHTQKLDHFTQELRLIGETGRLKWTTGSYFFLQDTSTSTEYELFGGLRA